MKQLALVCLWGVVTCSLSTAAEELQLTETDDSIRITLRGKPVLEYVRTARPVPKGIEQYYSRSGYIHPVYTPTGQEISGDYPADHAHQHALFFAWTKSRFANQGIDFWNQARQLAGVEFREITNISRKEKQVSFTAKHAFTVGTGNDKVDALYELWTVTVHLTPEDYFLFDLESVQTCASAKPLILEEHHYGGMAFRGNIEWLTEKDNQATSPGDLVFLTSDGKGRLDGNHTRPNWVALSGSLEQQDVSLAVFCHPKNFRAPQHVRLHPRKPYFCFAPAVGGQFRIEPGKAYVSRYRYLVTSQPVDADQVNAHWKKYVQENR